MTHNGKPFSAFIIAIIRFYRYFVSPVLPSSCRFQPTCSEYMMQAIHSYGLSQGIWLGLKRIGKCWPGRPGGFDPVPKNQENTRPS